MATLLTTSTGSVTLSFHSFTQPAVALLDWLIAWETNWRQARRMEQLTNEERRDMGMPCRAELPRLPDYGW